MAEPPKFGLAADAGAGLQGSRPTESQIQRAVQARYYTGGLLRLYSIPQWLLLRIFVQKVSETNLNFSYRGVKIKCTFIMSIL